MNFELSDDQQSIKRTARDFLADRYTPAEVRRIVEGAHDLTDEQWAEISALGWPGVVISEDHNGLGLGMVELAILQEELGYALVPTPLLSTVSAALLLRSAGDDRILPRLATGSARGTVALWDEGATSSSRTFLLDARNGSISGTKIAVADADRADVIVVAGADGRHFLVERSAPGVSVEQSPSLDPTRKLFTVRLDEVRARELGGEPAAIARAYDAIAIAIAAESVGVAQRALEMAVEYAKERKQFGRPIGAFQAVSHRCAQMLLEVEGARAVTYFAGWALDNDPDSAALAASVAKAYAGEAGWRVPASAIQVHGGIGFTWEHDLHLFLKRGKANAHAFGDSDWHLARIFGLVEPLMAG